MCVIIISRMGKIARYLNQLIIGNVFDSPEVIESYATDRSALKIKPKIVALPESTDDIRKLMRFCYQLASKGINMPVTVRGSGLDEGGADLGNSIVVSTEKLNRLLEADRRERLVRVQAGMTLRELNTALSVNGLTIPVGGRDNETIGGLISNSPCDDFAGKYGGIMPYVERVEVVLANGEVLQSDRFPMRVVNRRGKEKTLEGKVYARLPQILNTHKTLADEIAKHGRSSYGYPAAALAAKRGSLDVMPVFFGAQGTLGIITEVILRAVPLETRTARVVATFRNVRNAVSYMEAVNKLKPRELEIYDVRIIKAAAETGKRLTSVTDDLDSGYVVFARFDTRAKQAIKKLAKMRKDLPEYSKLILESAKNATVLGEFENSLTNFLAQAKSGERVPILTDFYVPGKNLASMIDDLVILEGSLKMELAIFGSFSASNYSVRPKFKLSDKDFNKLATTFLRTGAFIVKRQGGELTGGTPEGRVKAMVTNTELTDEEWQFYTEIKNLFDRYNILNPDVKLGADANCTVRHFRDDNIAPII